MILPKVVLSTAYGLTPRTRKLLESKGNPSAGDYDGRTALHVACSHKNAEVSETKRGGGGGTPPASRCKPQFWKVQKKSQDKCGDYG